MLLIAMNPKKSRLSGAAMIDWHCEIQNWQWLWQTDCDALVALADGAKMRWVTAAEIFK
jgi:hypothetical protein